jgi:hypothetical protein
MKLTIGTAVRSRSSRKLVELGSAWGNFKITSQYLPEQRDQPMFYGLPNRSGIVVLQVDGRVAGAHHPKGGSFKYKLLVLFFGLILLLRLTLNGDSPCWARRNAFNHIIQRGG